MKTLIATLAVLLLLSGCNHVVAERQVKQCKWVLRYDPCPHYRNFSWETTWQESPDLNYAVKDLPMADYPTVASQTSGAMYINDLADTKRAEQAVIDALNKDMQNSCLNREQP